MWLCPKNRTWDCVYGALPQTPPAFLSEKSGAKELDFSSFTLSFRVGVYALKTVRFRERLNFYFYLLDRESWSGTLPHFFPS